MLNPKHSRAVQLIKEGHSVQTILARLRKEFGAGLATSTLGALRTEVKRGSQPSRSSDPEIDGRRDFVMDLLLAGVSGSAARRKCREKFGVGVGYNYVRELAAEVKRSQPGSVAASSVAASPADDTMTVPVEIPAEMLLVSPPTAQVETPKDPTPAGRGLKWTLPVGDVRRLQRWMRENNVSALTLTQEGTLSVQAQHEFIMGDPDDE